MKIDREWRDLLTIIGQTAVVGCIFVLLIMLLGVFLGCAAAERQELVRYAAESAVNAAVDRFSDKVQPDSPIEEILAMLAGTLAIVGHRWWGWRKGKYVRMK